MIQTNLFVFLDSLVHLELLCVRNAFCGESAHGDFIFPRREEIEDDYATTCEPGIANFVRSLLKPLEAQGRGFSHGHEKVHSVPAPRAARLRRFSRCS